MTAGDTLTPGKILLTEYERIKEEQKIRIGIRDNLIYVTLAAMAAVIAATLQAEGHANLLLLLPPVSVLLGWTYVVNDEKISAIGCYIRNQLAPRLADMTDDVTPILGWEVAHRNDSRRLSRKYLQFVVDLSTFCLAPLAAIVVYWVSGPRTIPFVAVSAFELVGICVLAWQIAIYADLRKSGAGPS